jgi:hypothetical protein
VLSLLSKLLSDEMPTAGRVPTAAEVELARPLGGLSEAHIFELVKLAASRLESSAPAVSQAAVFSRWLAALTVNLDDAEGLAAIRSATPNEIKATHQRWKRAAAAHVVTMRKIMSRLEKARTRGSISCATNAANELEALRPAVECPCVLKPNAVAVGGGDYSGPPRAAAAPGSNS